jgi:hypothetical protein
MKEKEISLLSKMNSFKKKPKNTAGQKEKTGVVRKDFGRGRTLQRGYFSFAANGGNSRHQS